MQRQLVRLVDLASGQRVQATVAAILGEGRVLLGLMGGLVEATTSLELEAGRSYDFTVASTHPRIVLSTARPILLSGVSVAVGAGLLGPPLPPTLDAIQETLQNLQPPPTKGDTPSEGAPVQEELASALANLRRGAPTAANLQTIQRFLGHDQEARVLRLPSRPERAEVELLRHTLKAVILQFLAKNEESAQPSRTQTTARELASALTLIQVDNAQRSEQGAPQWLPLPVAEGGDLRDARMFALPGDSGEGSGHADSEARPFTVVLLLDFTRLGQMRVDLQVHGGALSATFVAVESSTVHALVADVPALRQRLEAQGLEVRSLTVRAAPNELLPVADLVLRPETSTSMVDIHA